MSWKTDSNGRDTAILGGFHLRLDRANGIAEMVPGAWYASLKVAGSEQGEQRQAIIEAGYVKLEAMVREYRERALELGVAIAPPTFID